MSYFFAMQSSLTCKTLVVLLLCVGGCLPSKPEPQQSENKAPAKIDLTPREALLADQKAVYPELHDGKCLFLVEFEPDGTWTVDQQVACFSLEGAGPNDKPGPRSQRKLTHLLQRTGYGALTVTLDPQTALVYHFPREDSASKEGDEKKSPEAGSSSVFAGTDRQYTLLSMAILSGAMRDDLRVTLISGKGKWTSGPTLLRKGWNQVLIDIQRLDQLPDFDAKDVRAIRLSFIKAADVVTFTLDDIVLIDNYARVAPVPAGVIMLRNGLDFAIKLPVDEQTAGIRQGEDGLWRLGLDQPIVQLFPAGEDDYFGEGEADQNNNHKGLPGEHLEPLGPNRVGQIKVEEHNPVRIRISNSWLFPSRAGQWAMVGIRHLKWIYTVYPDGRWITDIQLNNAGGKPVSQVSISLPDKPAAWAGPKGGISQSLAVNDFIGPSGQWSYMQASDGPDKDLLIQNYLKPVRIETILAGDGFSPGDLDHDGFDESQGCYYLEAVNGHCRFKILPPPEGVLNPVFRVAGPWQGEPSVNLEGLAVQNVSSLPDGCAVFMLDGKLTKPVFVEVFGAIKQRESDKKD